MNSRDRTPRPADANASRGVANSGADKVDKTGGRQALGQAAESFVARELERRGFALLGRNVRVGRLEIDIIARRGSLIVICEVRARRSDAFMSPAESLDRRKLERIRRAATLWLARSGLRSVDVRLDVAAVVYDGATPHLEYYEGAF